MSYISLGRAQKRSTWCLIIAMFALASVKYSVIHIFGHVKYRCVDAILKDNYFLKISKLSKLNS